MPDDLPASPDSNTPQVTQDPVPLIYFNGFRLQFGGSDTTITLKVDSQNMAVLKASYTVAKTLSQALTKLISDFEKVTSHDVMTIKDVQVAIKESKLPQANEQ